MNTTDNNMSTEDNNEGSTLSKCANCGKEGSNLNSCNKCKMVTYCNAACKKKHRSKHKKKCDRHVSEMYEEALFKQPPQREDCPICFLRLPSLHSGSKYNACCGKIICSGCTHAVTKMDGNVDDLCPFCRAPAAADAVQMVMKRMEVDDAIAMDQLGRWYQNGDRGFPQNADKALDFFHRAGELGHVHSYHSIGCAYFHGDGVERDEKKAKQYWELAAIGGDVSARYYLGILEERAGNMSRALMHYMIAAECGVNGSLKEIRKLYTSGHATKDDFAKALRAHQKYVDGIKSDQRDKATAFNREKYRYY